jgi:hypothetical protein
MKPLSLDYLVSILPPAVDKVNDFYLRTANVSSGERGGSR